MTNWQRLHGPTIAAKYEITICMKADEQRGIYLCSDGMHGDAIILQLQTRTIIHHKHRLTATRQSLYTSTLTHGIPYKPEYTARCFWETTAQKTTGRLISES
jgi:hypothetical protein